MSIRIHDGSVLRPFRDGDEVRSHFELTDLPSADLDRLKAASDAGTPAFVCVDPQEWEIRDRRALLIEDTLEGLRFAREAASDGI